jgi:pyruvate/2-oxoglutarate dehydrogenase complex dihydrolipoamide dehydrogenase (E3) component
MNITDNINLTDKGNDNINNEIITDVLIVGGGPAGMMTGITAAQFCPGKKVLVVRKESDAVIPCGIPYIFGTLGGTDEDMAGRLPLIAAGGEILIGNIVEIDNIRQIAYMEYINQDYNSEDEQNENIAAADGKISAQFLTENINKQQRLTKTNNGNLVLIKFNRLVLATGGRNFIPPIKGTDLEGVFSIQKDYNYLENLFTNLIPKVKKLAIIGGGFIGVEFADEIRKLGIEVHIIEMLPHLMQVSFDLDVCAKVEEILESRGIAVHTGCQVEEIISDPSEKKVAGLRIKDKEDIKADAVLIAIGVKPNVELAKKIGLTLSRSGGVWVDAFQRSREDDKIFAVGDCAHKQDFFTRKANHAMIASQAAAEGRIAGMNLYSLRLSRYNAGSVSVYSSEIDGLAFGVAGLTQAQAVAEGFDILIGESRLPDHHPASMPNTTEIYCRLIFSKESMQLLGGQITGGQTTGELVNTIGLAIQMHATATDIATMQFGSQPRLTPSLHPMVAATGDALRKNVQIV